MAHTILRAATKEDAYYLSARLRKEDLAELRASSGMQPLPALLAGMAQSVPHAWVLCEPYTGNPFLMGGIRPVEPFGIVWMLTTPAIERHALTVQKEAKAMLRRVFTEQSYTALCNVVAASNTRAVAWLKRLGFTFVHKNQPIGQHGELFHTFAMPGGVPCARL